MSQHLLPMLFFASDDGRNHDLGDTLLKADLPILPGQFPGLPRSINRYSEFLGLPDLRVGSFADAVRCLDDFGVLTRW